MYRRHLFGPSLPLLTRLDLSLGLLCTDGRHLQNFVSDAATSPDPQLSKARSHPDSQEATAGQLCVATQNPSTLKAATQVKGNVWTEEDFPSYPTDLLKGHPTMTPKLYKHFVKVHLGQKVPPQDSTDEELHRAGYRSWKECVYQGRLANWE